MSFRRPILTRPLVLLAAVATLVLTVAAPVAATVPPEKYKGQHGHYAVLDSSSSPLVNCRYAGSTPPKLDRFVAKPPGIWWTGTDSNKANEHGRVGWQVRIQSASNPSTGPWSLDWASTVVKATVYESEPAYDPGAAAQFTTRGFTWHRSGTRSYRLIYKLFWYKKDGSVRGSVTHWIDNYKLTGTGGPGVLTGHCPNKLFN